MQLPLEKSGHYSNGRQITPFCRYILRCQNWSLRALARSTNSFMEGSLHIKVVLVKFTPFAKRQKGHPSLLCTL